MRWTSGQLSSILRLPQTEDRPIQGRLLLDSRQAQQDDLFVALNGEHTNGHLFVPQALAQGAWVLAETSQAQSLGVHPKVLLVEDCRNALETLASAARDLYHGDLVAITGSNGKTTTKELVYHLVAADRRCDATKGNLNSTLGVPLTLINELDQQDCFVLEAGASAPGEIARICRIARPTHGCITNLAVAHLERFGSLEGVAKAKGELMQWMADSDGCAIVNEGDPLISSLAKHVSRRKGFNLATGLLPGGHRLQMNGYDDQARACLSLDGHELRLGVPGKAFLHCAFAALAIALALEVPVALALEILSQPITLSGRMRVIHAKGITLLDDCYNSNPASLAAAIDTMSHMTCSGKRIAVLGGMGELGAESERLHFEAGKEAAKAAIDRFLVVGTESHVHSLAEGLRSSGAAVGDPLDREAAGRLLQRECVPGDIVLLKGSRSYGLEKLLEAWL